jgi:hypothetical protein
MKSVIFNLCFWVANDSRYLPIGVWLGTLLSVITKFFMVQLWILLLSSFLSPDPRALPRHGAYCAYVAGVHVVRRRTFARVSQYAAPVIPILNSMLPFIFDSYIGTFSFQNLHGIEELFLSSGTKCQCSLLKVHRQFGEMYSFYLQVWRVIQARTQNYAGSTQRRYIPEDRSLHRTTAVRTSNHGNVTCSFFRR